MSELTGRVDQWRDRGRFVDVDGFSIYVQERDGSGDGDPIVFLHGYPSSSFDWRLVADLLPGRRLLLFDFVGFGLSSKPPHLVYSLLTQADLVEALVTRFAGGHARLVAHDMGTSVANELMARDLDTTLGIRLSSVLLLNGSMVIDKASLTPAQKVLRSRFGPLAARLSSRRAFDWQFSRIFSAAHPLTADEADDQWCLLEHNRGHRVVDRLTYYLHERVTFAHRWHRAITEWPSTVELAWAGRDPVCTEAVLQAVLDLRPGVRLTRWPELGHYPQLEDPAAVAAVIDAWAV